MERFDVYKFDGSTFVVFGTFEKREICVCSNYDDWAEAEERAEKIANTLNQNSPST